MKFDLLIRGGNIIDGTGQPAFRGDVAVNGEYIAATGDLSDATAETEINATGKTVSPGFVDIHGHSDYFILIEPGAPNKIMQGVTSEIAGNCGYSAGPISKQLSDERGESLSKNFGLKPDWISLAEYHQRLEDIGPAINLAVLVGHNTIRASVMGGSAQAPDRDQLKKMQNMVEEGMAHGAFGISTGLIYPPGCFADSDELAELCRPANSGFLATHMRSEGVELISSIEEVIDAAGKADIRLQISHLKTSGQRNWHKIDKAFELMEDARESGIDVHCDRYPYIASFTGLSAVLPVWAFEGTRDEFRARLLETEVREKIRKNLETDHPNDYLDKVVIAQTFSAETHKYEGKSVMAAAGGEGKEPLAFLLDLLAAEESDPTAVYHTMSEENMFRILRWDHAVVGSDSAARAPDGPLGSGKPHPRVYGCFSRALRLVREKGLMPIEEAVKKMSSEPARIAGLEKRGELKKGWYADIAIFDPEKVADNATYDSPHEFSAGMEWVFVNGQAALGNGKLNKNRFGKVLKKGT